MANINLDFSNVRGSEVLEEGIYNLTIESIEHQNGNFRKLRSSGELLIQTQRASLGSRHGLRRSMRSRYRPSYRYDFQSEGYERTVQRQRSKQN